jgi:hypothetical protein
MKKLPQDEQTFRPAEFVFFQHGQSEPAVQELKLLYSLDIQFKPGERPSVSWAGVSVDFALLASFASVPGNRTLECRQTLRRPPLNTGLLTQAARLV